MTASMQIAGPVAEGSVLLLRGLGSGNEYDFGKEVGDAIEKACGHRRFVVIFADDAEGAGVEVWGPDVDLEAKVRDLIASAERA